MNISPPPNSSVASAPQGAAAPLARGDTLLTPPTAHLTFPEIPILDGAAAPTARGGTPHRKQAKRRLTSLQALELAAAAAPVKKCGASQSRLLSMIASGAQQVKAVAAQFGEEPPPEIDTLVKLHRVLIMQLSTQGNADPEILKLADRLLRTAMTYASNQAREQFKQVELDQAERKLQIAEKKAAAFDQAQEIIKSKLSPAEQRARLKEILK